MTAAAISTNPVRLTQKGRLALTVVATLLMILGIFTLTTAGAEASNEKVSAEVIQIIVSPGDTLWSIAKAVNPSQDPRETIYEIKTMNALNSSQVFPGQVLTIPAD